jgi:hypothetical protein
MKTELYVAIVIAALAIPILSHTVMAQSIAGYDRNLCVQKCAWLKPYGDWPGGSPYNTYQQHQNYTNCTSSCETQYWREFNKERGEPEKVIIR